MLFRSKAVQCAVLSGSSVFSPKRSDDRFSPSTLVASSASVPNHREVIQEPVDGPWIGLHERSSFMKTILGSTALALVIATTTIPAEAKGCIKGAIVGGTAGHFAGHHGLMGAAAGCAIGHHEAKKNEKAAQSPH